MHKTRWQEQPAIAMDPSMWGLIIERGLRPGRSPYRDATLEKVERTANGFYKAVMREAKRDAKRARKSK